MAPQAVTNPERRFVITQEIAGVETNVAVSTLLPTNFTNDQTLRAAQLSQAGSLRLANPSILYRLYSPSNGGAHTDGDCVWRSDRNT